MLPLATIAWAPLVGWLAVAGIIYGAIAAWVQSDVKKLVAYSSVSLLGFCLLGMFSLKMAGLTGSLLYMINHGLCTGALFLIVGMIYERYHTRELSDLSGLGRKMPIMAFFLVVFTMSSIGLPGLNGFVGEFLVLLGTFTSGRADASGPAGPLGVAYAIPAATGILLGAIYMLQMVKGVLFGPVKEGHGFDASSGLTPDLTRREIGILAPIAVVCLVLGVYPKPLTKDVMEPALQHAVLDHVLPVGGATWEQAVAVDRAAPAAAFGNRLLTRAAPARDAWLVGFTEPGSEVVRHAGFTEPGSEVVRHAGFTEPGSEAARRAIRNPQSTIRNWAGGGSLDADRGFVATPPPARDTSGTGGVP